MRKISFLIAAHNEEKIIGQTLENLTNLPYDDYEVIIGLDGCTDKTEEVVKFFCNKSKNLRYVKLNLRSGKPAVINNIIKMSSGEIVVINDADWILKVNDEKTFRRFFSIFDNPLVGGISEEFPLEWEEPQVFKRKDLGYKMVAYSSYFWYEFQKMKFTKKENNLLVISEPALFMTNIFRKKLYKDNTSLADDFERTRDILEAGFKVVISRNKDDPKMIPVYNNIPVRDLFKQKIRTARARQQIVEKSPKKSVGFGDYYGPAVFFLLKESWKKGIKPGFLVTFWVLITVAATLYSKLNNLGTKEGWTLRVRR